MTHPPFRKMTSSAFRRFNDHSTLCLMEVPCQSGCVLVVEDDADARDALARFVRRLGHEVVTATTASEALAAILLKLPEYVLLDLMLPGLTGVEVLRLIRSNHWPVRVAVVTAVADPMQFEDVRQLRPDAVFRKPLDLRLIKRWLVQGGRRPAAYA